MAVEHVDTWDRLGDDIRNIVASWFQGEPYDNADRDYGFPRADPDAPIIDLPLNGHAEGWDEPDATHWTPGTPPEAKQAARDRGLEGEAAVQHADRIAAELRRSSAIEDARRIQSNVGPTIAGTWRRRPLAEVVDGIIDGTWQPFAPTVGARDDGHGLLYAGHVNEIHGESESGKSWFAVLVCAQEMAKGRIVAYIDFEDSLESLIGRLHLIGVDPLTIKTQFCYIKPLDPASPADLDELVTAATEEEWSVAIVDGVTEVLSMHGLDGRDEGDVATFHHMLPRALADKAGCAVLLIDHTPKSTEVSHKGAIGSQHKRAGLTGVGYLAEMVEQAGPGRLGKVRLTIGKDRPGGVRRYAQHGKTAGIMLIDATGPQLRIVIQPAEVAGQAPPPTRLMEQVSRWIEQANADGVEPSTTTLRKQFRSRSLDRALDALIAAGHVVRGAHGTQTFQHRSVKPYRDTTTEAGGVAPEDDLNDDHWPPERLRHRADLDN